MDRVKITYNNQIVSGTYIKCEQHYKDAGFTDMIKLDEPIYLGNLTSSLGLKCTTISSDIVEILEWF